MCRRQEEEDVDGAKGRERMREREGTRVEPGSLP